LKIPELRKKEGDRAVLRSLHFFREDDRVSDQVAALGKGGFPCFLNLITESGNSSFKWLQNIYLTKNAKEQGMTLALALTEKYLADIKTGACRVHGGGFAGQYRFSCLMLVWLNICQKWKKYLIKEALQFYRFDILE